MVLPVPTAALIHVYLWYTNFSVCTEYQAGISVKCLEGATPKAHGYDLKSVYAIISIQTLGRYPQTTAPPEAQLDAQAL